MNAYKSADPPKWEIGRPQETVERLLENGLKGPILDLGCGTGENAILMAKHGHDVRAVDPSPIAIEKAKQKAKDANVTCTFEVANGLDLSHLGQSFSTVLDSGVFHIFNDEQRLVYLSNLKSVLKSGGMYYAICFSDSEPGDWGPRRVSAEEIKNLFMTDWELVSLEASKYHIRRPDPVKAWLITAKRL